MSVLWPHGATYIRTHIQRELCSGGAHRTAEGVQVTIKTRTDMSPRQGRGISTDMHSFSSSTQSPLQHYTLCTTKRVHHTELCCRKLACVGKNMVDPCSIVDDDVHWFGEAVEGVLLQSKERLTEVSQHNQHLLVKGESHIRQRAIWGTHLNKRQQASSCLNWGEGHTERRGGLCTHTHKLLAHTHQYHLLTTSSPHTHTHAPPRPHTVIPSPDVTVHPATQITAEELQQDVPAKEPSAAGQKDGWRTTIRCCSLLW